MADTVCRLCGPELDLSSACVEELGPTGRQTSSERSQDLPLEVSGAFWDFSFSTKFSSFFDLILMNPPRSFFAPKGIGLAWGFHSSSSYLRKVWKNYG